jgi:general secretion pathway protein D
MVPYAPTGMLIVTDVQSNINRLLDIMEAIDVEGVGEEISIFPLQYASADTMEGSLTALFQRRVRGGKGTAEPAIKIVADERTNSLITLASEGDTQKIKQLIALLDRKTPRGEGDIRVYYLQHANAEDLSKVLMAIPTEAPKGEAKGKAPIVSKDVQIVPDKSTNSLVITASRADYLVLEDVIKKLDIPRRMVYLEALLVEVSINKNFALGVQWQAAEQIGSTEGNALYGFGQSIPPQSELAQVSPLSTGFAVGVLGETIEIGGVEFASLTAVLRALETESGVNILSTPQILALDNEEAEIIVAENIPYLTREGRTPADVDYNQYEFRDVGITLNITPQINQERFVRMVLSQEISQVVDQDEIGLPSTLKRSAKTTVVVEDSQTVVIGGLIDETLNQTEYRVPCLGNIPYVGWAFKTRASSGDRTNLYFFVTPHIVETAAEAKSMYEEKWDQIDKLKEESVKMYRKPWEKVPTEPDE